MAKARFAAPAPAGTPLDVAVLLRPRNPALLAELAASSSGRRPLTPGQVAGLFFPTDVAAVKTYLVGHGFSFRSRQGLALWFHGSAAAAERAFGVELGLYRSAGGRLFHAPAGAVRLPADLVSRVQAVEGLDDAAPARPASGTVHPNISPASPPCAGAVSYKTAHASSFLPADLASPNAYDYQSLLDGNSDGTGESIAFVEFSDYNHSDISTFQSCYGLSVPVTDVAVNGGTTDHSGAAEVELDIEVALAAAPDLDGGYVYEAPNPTAFSAVINAIVAGQGTTNAHILSISWGICEPFVTLADAGATNDALQLAAVSGFSVFAAAGDSGSADCGQVIPFLAVDDPAAQPYATGIGGTTLRTSGARTETVWNTGSAGGGSGGGGVSINWPMPSWQSGAGIVNSDSSGEPCGLPSGRYCREVPDVSFNADDNGRGYVVYCSAKACGYRGWLQVGGTSAGAPLFAGMTADANEHSLANGGARLGYANPFLYDRFTNDPTVFNDVTSGNNDLLSLGKYAAGSGYDLASGLGSVDGALFGADLAAYSAAPPNVDTTALTGSESVRQLVYRRTVTFSGTLTDTTTGLPLAGKVVWLEAHDSAGTRYWFTQTDGSGQWSISKALAIKRKTAWRAYFLGDEGLNSARSSAHVLYLVPLLSARAGLPLQKGRYVVTRGTAFTFSGGSAPHISGARVVIQYRVLGTSRWHPTGLADIVDGAGRFSRRAVFVRTGTYVLRWHYASSAAKRWLPASSPGRVVRVVSYQVVGFSTRVA